MNKQKQRLIIDVVLFVVMSMWLCFAVNAKPITQVVVDCFNAAAFECGRTPEPTPVVTHETFLPIFIGE